METLDPAAYRDVVRRALAEDLGWGDVTTSAVVATDAWASGVIVFPGGGIVAGLGVAVEAFRQIDPAVSVEFALSDGGACGPGEPVARLHGRAAALLTAERTALNLLGHLSGIATITRRMADAAGGRVEISDGERALPLLHALEQYAVRVGGGATGRLTLDEGIVVTANHVRLAGSVASAVSLARRAQGAVPVTAEVASPADIDEALAAGADVLLMREPTLDALVGAKRRSAGFARLHVSGRYGADALAEIARAGADRISVDRLIDSAPAVDVTFEIERA